MNRSRLLLFSTFLLLAFATIAFASIEAKQTLPEDGAVSSKPVRSLRVWFSEEPNVEASKIELQGPNGPLDVTGLHTMGEKDLMGRVVGAMPDGEYTAKWTASGDDGEALEGSWSFTIQRGSN